MPDNEDLRFTMELKDLFTEVFEKVKDNVESGSESIKANLGGLSKALAVVGVGAAIGTAVYGAWETFKNKVADVTKEAEKLETTLGNILGSKGVAKGVLQELANSDLTKVFKIKEIDEGYTTLANHGLKATLAQMRAIGDLSAGTGKDFNQVVDAIVRGGEGRTETIKSLGIDVVRNKNKKAGIDDLTLSFRGQTQTVKNNAAAIQEYLLNLGMIPGIQGSMAKSADDVAASENSLNNQITRLWENLGERFNPSVVESKGMLSKWVATINSWIEIPVDKKVNEEVTKIHELQTELTSSNTSEERRKTILEELKEINPKITEGIDDEAISYSKLAENIESVTKALQDKITLSQIQKQYKPILDKSAEANLIKAQTKSVIDQVIYAVSPEIAKSNLSDQEKQRQVAAILKSRGGKVSDLNYDLAKNGVNAIKNDDGSIKNSYALTLMQGAIRFHNMATDKLAAIDPQLKQMQDEKNTLTGNISKSLGLSSVAGNDNKPGTKPPSNTSIDKGGIASINGGGQIRNITININKLIDGGVNVHTTTLKEGVSKAKDIVVEGLLTAVNDANLVGNN